MIVWKKQKIIEWIINKQSNSALFVKPANKRDLEKLSNKELTIVYNATYIATRS